MNASPHVLEELPDFLTGALSDSDALRVRTHLLSCLSCRAELDEAQMIRDVVRSLPRRVPPPASQVLAPVLAAMARSAEEQRTVRAPQPVSAPVGVTLPLSRPVMTRPQSPNGVKPAGKPNTNATPLGIVALPRSHKVTPGLQSAALKLPEKFKWGPAGKPVQIRGPWAAGVITALHDRAVVAIAVLAFFLGVTTCWVIHEMAAMPTAPAHSAEAGIKRDVSDDKVDIDLFGASDGAMAAGAMAAELNSERPAVNASLSASPGVAPAMMDQESRKATRNAMKESFGVRPKRHVVIHSHGHISRSDNHDELRHTSGASSRADLE